MKGSPTRWIHLYGLLGNVNKSPVMDSTAVAAWRQGQKETGITKGPKETLGGDESFSVTWLSFPRCWHIPEFALKYVRFMFLNDTSSWKNEDGDSKLFYVLFSPKECIGLSWVFSVFESHEMAFHYTYWVVCTPFPCSVYSWFMAERETAAQALQSREKADSNLGSPFASCLALGNLLNF